MKTSLPNSYAATDNLMTNYLLCCDWGTSLFRLRLMNTPDYVCVGEISSQAGVATLFDDWKTTGKRAGISREHFFRQRLETQIDRLATQTGIRLAGVPVVVSGMASSSIGMAEVPYATLPFATDGSQSSIRHFTAQTDFPHEITLISGVRSQQDVMRGEETQLIGLITLLNRPTTETGETLENALYLSGLLIGTELNHLLARPTGQIVLCSGSNLSGLYQLAIATMGLQDRTIVVAPDLVDEAASVGQIVLQQEIMKETVK